MFDTLKRMAIQRLVTKMASNSLGAAATEAAAQEGASGIMAILQSKLAGGSAEQVKELFSGGDLANNGIFAEAKAKMAETLQAKGMSAEEAETEAANTTPDLINSLKDKFQSQDEADAGFNLESLTDLIPGGAGGLLNKAKNLLG